MSSLGVLETIWLAKNDPRFIQAGEAVERVELPLVENLRKALVMGNSKEVEGLLTRVESELSTRNTRSPDDS